MPEILTRKTFYGSENSEVEYRQTLIKIQNEALTKTTHYKGELSIDQNPKQSLRGAIGSTETIARQLPECDRRNFEVATIAALFAKAFSIEILSKHCKVNFFVKSNKLCSLGKSISMWSDTRRDAFIMASYWVKHFFEKIILNEQMKEAMDPLRSESENKPESIYAMISCVAMIMAGANEKDPLSPILAIAKIYHEYLYYINSIVDNKHGVEANAENYQTKVRDYTLASNLILGKLKQYIEELKITEFLNDDQYRIIMDLFDELNSEMMSVFKKDYGSQIDQYFDNSLNTIEQQQVLDYWTDHAVNMTGKWTGFFAIIGAISANEKYENTNCNSETINAFGKIWGYGQLINGFKDFVVMDSVADDIREKRCTPQILHLLFQSSNSSDKTDFEWIKSTIKVASKANSDITAEQKAHFVKLFQKYGTVEYIKQKCKAAIDNFWQIYYTDTTIQESLKRRNMDLKMRAMINGGLVSFFESSRYLPK